MFEWFERFRNPRYVWNPTRNDVFKVNLQLALHFGGFSLRNPDVGRMTPGSLGCASHMGMDQYLLIQFFNGMNIHLPAILGFTRYQGFDPSPRFLTFASGSYLGDQPHTGNKLGSHGGFLWSAWDTAGGYSPVLVVWTHKANLSFHLPDKQKSKWFCKLAMSLRYLVSAGGIGKPISTIRGTTL